MSDYLKLNQPLNDTLRSWDICFNVSLPPSISMHCRVLQSSNAMDAFCMQVGYEGLAFRIYD